MPLFETPDQIVSALLIWFSGFMLIEIIRKKFGVGFFITHFLYVWHSIFCLIYLFYVLGHSGDALNFYYYATERQVLFGVGSPFVRYLTYLLAVPLHLSIVGIFLVFNIIGYLGLLAFYGSLNSIVRDKQIIIRVLAVITVFLPSVSFWTAALGKDSISFMATGFALWAALNLKNRLWLMIFAILIMGLVRPHIASILFASLSLSFIINHKMSLLRRLILILSSLVIALTMISYTLKYLGLGSNILNGQIITYIENRQYAGKPGGGSVDLHSMSLPSKLFTYLFRPLPYEAYSVNSLLASLDNLYLFLLFLLFLWGFYKGKIGHNTYNITFMIIFSIVTWLILALTTANLGTSVRQKWMLMPFLLFIFFLYIRNITFKIHKQSTRE